MRLFSAVVAAVLFFSPAVLAQHSSTGSSSGGSSSSGSTSGGGSHAASSSGGSGSSSHGSSSAGSSPHSGSGSHSTAVRSSTAGSASASHGSGNSRVSNPTLISPRSPGSSTVSRSKDTPGETVAGTSQAQTSKTIRDPVVRPTSAKNALSATKSGAPEKRSFFSFLRHPFRKSEVKPVHSDLRRPICKEGPCKKPETPVMAVSDLRPPICKGKDCHCGPGETPGKNGGCVAAPTNTTCAAGQIWNGAACGPSSNPCPPYDYWNGSACVPRVNDCASINARAAMLANEVRSTKSQMQNACLTNSSSQECDEVKLSYDGAVERYRLLQNEAPVNCRTMLADPLSF